MKNQYISDCCIVSDTNRTEKPFNTIPTDFMASELRRSALMATKYLIENSRKSQESIDEIDEKLCNITSNEMETSIPKVVY